MRKSGGTSTVRVVLDANILVSAAFGGVPAQALTKAHGQQLLVSSEVRDEWIDILGRLRDKLSAAMAIRFQSLIHAALAASELVEVRHQVAICRDPKDNAYLSLARSGSADLLVTGDVDLLQLDKGTLAEAGLANLRILNPRDYLDRA